MTGKLSTLVVHVLAWPIPPRAIAWVSLALCLTVIAIVAAQIHSFTGVVFVGIIATLGASGLRMLLRRQMPAR